MLLKITNVEIFFYSLLKLIILKIQNYLIRPNLKTKNLEMQKIKMKDFVCSSKLCKTEGNAMKVIILFSGKNNAKV